MWMNAYEVDTLIRQQIAEAQRQGATQQWLRAAALPKAGTRSCSAIRRFIETVSALRLKRRTERMALR
jgi:hypothetical protein